MLHSVYYLRRELMAYSEMTTDRGLGEQAGVLAQLTRDLAQCCIAKESEIFERFGLSTSEGNVLLAVAEGSGSPSALATRLGVVRSRITPLVRHLVDHSFLERNESQTDRRVRELTLTRKGEQVAADAEQYRLSFHRRLLERFNLHERQQLFITLSQLQERMTEMRKGIQTETLAG